MRCYHQILCLVLVPVYFALGQEKREIFLGGLFKEQAEAQTDIKIFELAVNSMNEEVGSEEFEFKPLIDIASNDYKGPLKAKLSTCSLIDQQALVIFGPNDEEDINIVQSICDHKDIAHVLTRWVYDPGEHGSTINFYPHSSYLNDAYFSILQKADWKSFTLFYENNESLLRMAELLDMAKNSRIVVVVRQLDEFDDGIYRKSLKEAVISGEKNYIIDCSGDILEEVLRQIQQVGLMTSQYTFLITNLDLQFIDLEPFQYSGANITGIRIFDPNSEIAAGLDISKTGLKTETAILVDAIFVLGKVINDKLSIQDTHLENVRCDSMQSSRLGDTISNHVKTSKNVGLTGLIEFDGNGFRSNFNLDVIEIVENGVSKTGTWNSSKGFVSVRTPFYDSNEAEDSLRNKTFKVITCLTAPFCMLKETPDQLFKNDRFEGFAIDLISELAAMEGFNYTFLIRDDKKNGEKSKLTGQWTGMIGDVMHGKADLAITDLTITAEREEAVDFTSPFMNLGISILAQKPGNAPPSFFSFADPFALDTWMMLGLAYGIVSLSFFILGRLCQEEWTNPYPCVEEPEFLNNQFSLSNSAWFAAGALMQQGTEIGPIAVSTRMLTGMWWFFVLIMVSSYTANLAAFLATENPLNLFTDVETLVQNREKHDIRMGAKKGGATVGFFKGKTDPIYKEIAKYMEEHQEDVEYMPTDNKDGVALAEKITYAFFMESSSIEYEVQRHCTLQQYGRLLDDKGYGIAMRKNSTYRKRLSTAILKLQTSGELDKLKRKWWEEKRGGGQCLAGGEPETTPPLAVSNIEGVFYVTIGGTILAVFLVIAEMLIATYKMSKKANISFKEALQMEKNAFLDFNSEVKPAIRAKSRSGSKSTKESENNHNLISPAAYGFIPAITKEEIKD